MSTTKNGGIARAQANFCLAFVKEALDAVLANGDTADRFAAAKFRREKRIGSRDRRFISNTLFAAFRWLGWIRAAGIEANLPLALAAASAAEGSAPDAAFCWAAEAGIAPELWTRALSRPTPGERFAALLSIPEPPDAWNLFPAWFKNELPEPLRKNDTLPLYMQKRPPMWLRAQTPNISALIADLNRSGFAAEQLPFSPNSLKIADARGSLYNTPEFLAGKFEIQDFSSQCIGRACMAQPGESWWDVCAGGGGKSLQLADMMQRRGTVYSTDIRAYKLEDLKRRAARAAFPNIRCAEWDGTRPTGSKAGQFDGLLIDAPCSSSGRWRRNPDGRWTTPLSRVEELTAIQSQILENASAGVRRGGVLVYATCSLFEREDEKIVLDFLSRHPEFHLEPFRSPDGTECSGMLRTLPMSADCDASFVARMRNLT